MKKILGSTYWISGFLLREKRWGLQLHTEMKMSNWRGAEREQCPGFQSGPSEEAWQTVETVRRVCFAARRKREGGEMRKKPSLRG